MNVHFSRITTSITTLLLLHFETENNALRYYVHCFSNHTIYAI